MIGMQEKNDKMFMEEEMKEAQLEAKQIDSDEKERERISAPNDGYANTQYPCYVATRCSIMFHAF